jgi:hypothetical protein
VGRIVTRKPAVRADGSYQGPGQLPRWLRLGSAIAMLSVASLLVGVILGWVARGALIPDPGTETASPGQNAPAEVATTDMRPMPDVRGLSEADARQVLADAGYVSAVVKISEVPSVMAAGTIAAQDPVAGTLSPASITLSLPSPATMPPLAGKPVEEATRTLSALGAQASLKRVYDSKVSPGTVLETVPAPGVVLNATPELTVAGAPASATLSSLKAEGSCGAVSSGSVNGTTITDGVKCDAGPEVATTFWILGRELARLRATVGVDDTADPGARVKVVISADGRVLLERELGYGESADVDEDITGALRLEVKVSRGGPASAKSSREIVLLGNAVLLGSTEAIAALGSAP